MTLDPQLPTNLRKPNISEVLISRIATGDAMLFTGAGFSLGTSNILRKEPPAAKELAKDICRLGNFKEDEDLRFASDYYLSKNQDSQKLIELLKNKYTIVEVNKIHASICNAQWRRFYTTNYDHSIEVASAKLGKIVETVDLSFPTKEYYKRGGLCVHINGSINSLTADSLSSGFKLSNSSYISPETFTKSDWYYYFKKDIERSSAIVFVGYSMYDIEIQKILFEDETLREKTFFITQENPDEKLAFTLEKFGHVVPIGAAGLAGIFDKNRALLDNKTGEHNFQALCEYSIPNDNPDVRDSDVERFLMYGDIDESLIDIGMVSEQRIPYLVVREALNEVVDAVKNSVSSIIYSDLGNGKSIFLKELRARLHLNSFRVFHITDWDADYISDFDALVKSQKNCVILVDGYEPYIDLLEHFTKTAPSNLVIVASARTAEHERLKPIIEKLSFDYHEFCVDELVDREASEFIDIIDNVGMWGENAGLSRVRKKSILGEKNNVKLSVALLRLFEAPQIKERIAVVLKEVLANGEFKRTVFSVAILEILDIRPRYSIVSEVAENSEVYQSSFRNSENIKNLFSISGQEIGAKSSLFCLFLIKNYYQSSYITKELIRIAERFNSYGSKDYEQERVFKSMLRFSFIERLLPDANKKGNLRAYYENLKVAVPWLRNDPHYWLQYGMANITFKEYGHAQKFIDQAYSIARRKDNYHTSNIDTQQARLLIIRAIDEQDKSKIFKKFSEAHKLLSALDDDVYKYRQIIKYRDFYESCYSSLSGANRKSFVNSCNRILDRMKLADSRGIIDMVGNSPIRKARDNLKYIVSSVKA